MASAAEAARVKHPQLIDAVHHEMRYFPLRRMLRDLVTSGYLGEVRYAVQTVAVDYGVNPGMEPYWYTWVARKEQGGGFLTGMLSHEIDLLRHTLGDLYDVHGTVSIAVRDKPVLAWEYRDGDDIGPDSPTTATMTATADDTAVISGRLGNGAPFVLTGTWAVFNGSGNRIEVYGSDGTAVVAGGVLKAAQKGETLAEAAVPAAYALDPAAGEGMVPASVRFFEDVAAVVDGRRPAREALFLRASSMACRPRKSSTPSVATASGSSAAEGHPDEPGHRVPIGQRAVSASSARASHCSSASSSSGLGGGQLGPDAGQLPVVRGRSRMLRPGGPAPGSDARAPCRVDAARSRWWSTTAAGPWPGGRHPAGPAAECPAATSGQAGGDVGPPRRAGRDPRRQTPGNLADAPVRQATSRSVTRSRNVRSWLTVTRAPGHSSRKSSRARRVSRSRSLVGSSSSSTFGRPARTISSCRRRRSPPDRVPAVAHGNSPVNQKRSIRRRSTGSPGARVGPATRSRTRAAGSSSGSVLGVVADPHGRPLLDLPCRRAPVDRPGLRAGWTFPTRWRRPRRAAPGRRGSWSRRRGPARLPGDTRTTPRRASITFVPRRGVSKPMSSAVVRAAASGVGTEQPAGGIHAGLGLAGAGRGAPAQPSQFSPGQVAAGGFRLAGPVRPLGAGRQVAGVAPVVDVRPVPGPARCIRVVTRSRR